MSRKRKRKEWKDGDTGESGRKTTLSDRVFIGRAKADAESGNPSRCTGTEKLAFTGCLSILMLGSSFV